MTPAERIEYLEEENRQLREALRGSPDLHFPAKWELCPAEKRILRSLIGANDGYRSRTALKHAASVSDATDEQTINVHVSRLRRKLAPFGVNIATVYGQGYQIDAPSRQHVLTCRRQEIAA